MSAPSHDPIAERLRATGLVPVIVIDDPDRAEPLAEALERGGLACAEVTFRTPRATEALQRIAKRFPGFLVGAGTVLTIEQASRARDAGAQFAVAPGLNVHVVEHCQRIGLPMYPGVATPSDVETALSLGLRLVKLFPAEALGGIRYLTAIAAPYGEMAFMPTGGITRETLSAYLALPRVAACGGSWIAPAEWIAAGEFDRIATATTEAMTIVRQHRPAGVAP